MAGSTRTPMHLPGLAFFIITLQNPLIVPFVVLVIRTNYTFYSTVPMRRKVWRKIHAFEAPVSCLTWSPSGVLRWLCPIVGKSADNSSYCPSLENVWKARNAQVFRLEHMPMRAILRATSADLYLWRHNRHY
jgi:hypothetical protein